MAEKSKRQESGNKPASGSNAPVPPAKSRSTRVKGHPAHNPDPGVTAEIESVSHGPAALKVAHAPHGSDEDSDYAKLPASYPYRTRIRTKDYEAQKAKLHPRSQWNYNTRIIPAQCVMYAGIRRT